MEHKKRFLNFPIALLRGFPENHKKCLEDILLYSVYGLVYSEHPKFRKYDSLEDFLIEWEIDFIISDERTQKIFQTKGAELFDSFCGTKHVWTGIHSKTWWGYYKEDREFDDLMLLLAFLAFKSIIQSKPWAKVTNEYLLTRMSGFDSMNENDKIPGLIKEFMGSERKRRRLFTELETNFSFNRKPGNQRGIICSMTLSPAEIEFEYQKSRFLTKTRKLNDQKKKDKQDGEEKFKQWLKDNYGIDAKPKKGDPPKEGDQEKPKDNPDSEEPEDNSDLPD
jgi:hypothetical protein